MTQTVRLVDVAVSRQQATCTLSWSDGATQIVSLADLRRQCPCATCNQLRAEANPLQVFSGPVPTAELLDLEPVGGYALRFHWADGHSSGIYSFGLLREMGGA